MLSRCTGFAVAIALLLLTSLVATAQDQPAGSLTGDPRIDEWVRTTFGQPVDPETLTDPVWGTKTLLSLSGEEREGARLFMQRCNVCHGAAMNGVVAYRPLLSKKTWRTPKTSRSSSGTEWPACPRSGRRHD